ncbi:MAG: bifunctional 4-hydroxy-3-methylbut-2-enyl diphosphate reductase/30S ribosomal protein S1 [Bacillota bacterium]|jgi:ribosomal protein S1/(E)-4-hydroxy-3-methyl-but-2-enyl pyrophosphate reductase
MDITMAKTAGFCFGVKRAIRMALEASAAGEVCSLGPLIHNQREVDRLSGLGVRWAERMEDLTGDTVIIRSHGVPPDVMEALKAKEYRIIDATCPFVKKAQRIAAEAREEADLVVIVGDRDHPEVIGLRGFSGEKTVVVGDLADAKRHTYHGTVAVLSQTTYSLEAFEEVVAYIRSQAEKVVVNHTICKATVERQEEAAAIAKTVDIVLVVGGKNSANTGKLAQIAAANGARTAVIESVFDIDNIFFKDAEKIGVTAGASTPDWIIEEVLEKMKEDTVVMEEKILNEVETAESEVKEEAAVETAAEEIVEAEPEAAAETEEAAEAPAETEEAAEEPAEEPTEAEEAQEEPEEETMAATYAAYSKDIAIVRRGERLSGTIIKVSDSELMVDIGAKSEGIIPKSELTPAEAENITELFKEGDPVEVIVIKRENEDGHPLLSKKRVDVDIAWEKLAQAMEDGDVLEGKVLDVVKGGLLVDVGLKGFVPASLVEMGFVSQLDKYKDQTINFKVLECDKSHNKLILSRKAFLEEEKAAKAAKVWDEIEKDQVRRGTVQRITNFGAFIDLDGVDGLLHVSQMAWYRVNHPSEILNIGDEIDVYVLNVDKENQKISLGLKQLIPDPWSLVPEKYPVDAIVEAKVVRTATFGAFVQLEPGVEGLVHISQLAWGRVAKTEDAVTPGDIVNVKILGFDLDSKKISLSIKETMDRPEQTEAPAKKREPKAEVPSYTPDDDDHITIADMIKED